MSEILNRYKTSMPYCFECGDEIKDEVSPCDSCGWYQKNDDIELNDNRRQKSRCSNCERAGKYPSISCGICKEVWFCRWCHSHRIKRIREIFTKLTTTVNFTGMKFQPTQCTASGQMVIEFNKYEPCLECSRKLIKKLVGPTLNNRFWDSTEFEFSTEEYGNKYSTKNHLRLEEILNSFGFNRDLFFIDPLEG